MLIRTRTDEFVLLTGGSIPEDIGLTVTDITHGRGVLRAQGPDTARMLSKVCGLDFSEGAFPDYHAAQSSLAKVKALIIRRDEDNLPTFLIVSDRSLTAYVSDVVSDCFNCLIDDQ